MAGCATFRAQTPKRRISPPPANNPNLSGADLSKADLSRANLSSRATTNLSRADLSRANLSRADLSRANLSGADLSGAKLSAGTVITQEQLDKTVAGPTEKSPIFMGDVRDAKTEAPLNWQQRTP